MASRTGAVLLALAALPACERLAPDLDQVIAIEVLLPGEGRIEVTDTVQLAARALNGRGDSVAAASVWASLDTGFVTIVDSATGLAAAKAVGTARVQARVGPLRSNPQNLFVLPPLDSARADGETRDTVTVSAPDSLSDSLMVLVFAPAQGTEPLRSRRVAYEAEIYPPGATTVTFVPGDTVQTGTTGTAATQLRLTAGARPDSVRVQAVLRRPDGTPVPGTLIFVVEFRP